MTTPTTWPVPEVFGGIAKDASQAAATPMTNSIGTAKPVQWNDKPNWLKDTSLRGSMVSGPSAMALGVLLGEVTFPESPVYLDSFGFALGNILGDLTVTGSSAPYSNAFSTLNSASGQGTTHTYEQYYGPTATSGARLFTGLAFTEVSIMWDVAKKWLTWSGKASCWASQAAGSKPTNNQSGVLAIPSWRMLMGLGGPASGGTQVMTCKSGKVTIKREVTPEYTGTGTQNPYIMQRGGLSAAFDSLTFVTTDETIYSDMIGNSQPQMQLVFPNGLSGASQGALQLDMAAAGFEEAPPEWGGKLVQWKTKGDFLNNTTNSGASGGLSPIKATLTNAIASGTYI